MLLRGYYRENDYQAMHRLDLACFAPAFQFDLQTMKQAAEAKSAIVVVVEDAADHAMQGFILMHLQSAGSEKYAYVSTIDVAPGARQRGIGAAMLAHAEEQARAAGARRVALHVAVDNTAAIQFYQRRKYVRIGIARSFYPEAGLDALVFGKRLDGKRA